MISTNNALNLGQLHIQQNAVPASVNLMWHGDVSGTHVRKMAD